MHKKGGEGANFITGSGSGREKKSSERSLFNGRKRERDREKGEKEGKERKKVGNGRMKSSAKNARTETAVERILSVVDQLNLLIKGLRN